MRIVVPVGKQLRSHKLRLPRKLKELYNSRIIPFSLRMFRMVSFVSTVRQRGSDLTLTKTENKLAELYVVAVIKVNLHATTVTVKIISEAWHFSGETCSWFLGLALFP